MGKIIHYGLTYSWRHFANSAADTFDDRNPTDTIANKLYN